MDHIEDIDSEYQTMTEHKVAVPPPYFDAALAGESVVHIPKGMNISVGDKLKLTEECGALEPAVAWVVVKRIEGLRAYV